MFGQASNIGLKIACLALLTAWATTATAQKAKADQKQEADIHQKLESHQPREIAQAIEMIKKSKQPKDTAALTARIRNGLPSDLLDQAIKALVVIGNKAAYQTLIELASHRSEFVREKIAQGLSSFGSPGAMKVLKVLLDDQDAQVRAQAILSIGKIGAKPAMDQLIEAAKLGNPEAIEVVSKQATPAHVTRFTNMIDDDNLLVLTPLLQEFIRRKNIPKSHKLAIVKRLEKMSTVNSMAQLRLMIKDLPASDPIRLAATKAIERAKEEKNKEGK